MDHVTGLGSDDLETTPCDLCGADDTAVLFTGHDWAPDAPVGIAMLRCRRCGLMFLSPRPRPAVIGRFYPMDYAPFRPAIEDERWSLMRWMRRRKLVERRRVVERIGGRKAGAVLDVGCSTGLFLNEMSQAGWMTRGVELSPTATAYARRRFCLDVFEGMLEDAPLAPGSFDAVTFWDVLEHVYSPSATLALAARLLTPGGCVVVNVPNWDSLDRRLFGRHWQGWDPPRHLYVFTRSTLTALLRGAGLEPVAWRCIMPSYFTFVLSLERWLMSVRPGWARPVMRFLNLPGMRFLAAPLFGPLDRLGRGSVITVVARRA